MDTFLVVYVNSDLLARSCIVVASSKEYAEEKAHDCGIKSIVSVTKLGAYFLGIAD